MTSTGSFFYLYRLRRAVGVVGYSVSVGVAIFARVDMAGGRARLLCFVPILVRSYGLSGVLPAEGCASLINIAILRLCSTGNIWFIYKECLLLIVTLPLVESLTDQLYDYHGSTQPSFGYRFLQRVF